MISQSVKEITATAAQEVAIFIGVTAEVAMSNHSDLVFKTTCAIMAGIETDRAFPITTQ